MKHISLVVFVVVISSFHVLAQYRGGSNDGTAINTATIQNALPNIHVGGSNDGFAGSITLNQNAVPGIYLGGINDGFALASALNENQLPAIYAGGPNDGFSSINTAVLNPSTNIYFGGSNDGFAIASVLNENTLPAIYSGGTNDGFALASVLSENPLPAIYSGGANDGFAISVGLNKNQSVPLPVTLLQFTGNWFNDDAVLAWETGVETGLDHFELERSDDAGRSFGYVASIAPNTQAGQHDYRYTDVRAYYLFADFLLYRLRCVGKDGAFKYSAIVRLNKDKTAPVFVAYPNPTSGHFTLAIMNAADLSGYSYVLSSADGKIIRSGNIQEIRTSLDLSGFASATYHLLLFKNGKSIQHFTILLTQ